MSKWLRAYLLSCSLKWLQKFSSSLALRVSCVILGAVLFEYFSGSVSLSCGPCLTVCRFSLTLSLSFVVSKHLPRHLKHWNNQTKTCPFFLALNLQQCMFSWFLFDHILILCVSRARLKSGGWVGPFVVLWPRPAQMILSIPPCVHKGRKGSHQKLWEVRTYFGSKDLFCFDMQLSKPFTSAGRAVCLQQVFLQKKSEK